MNTQTAQYPVAKPGPGDTAGAGGNGTGQPGDVEQRLKSERVQEELRAMTAWAAVHGDAALESVKTFATPGIAGLYGAYVLQTAVASGYPVTVSLSSNQVGITVYAPESDGCLSELTLPVLAFARQL